PLSLESWLEAQIPQTKLELALGNINRASLPLAYILGLRPLCSIATALDLCLLCWYRTGERHCPKVEQLATAFSILSGKDTFLYAGTGFGKTLAAILHVYLERRNGITIIVTPLTRIQASHASSIESVYGFRVLVVNEQTTRDKGFWKAHVHDVGKNRPGDVQVILATPEQLLQSAEGHYSRLGQLLREPGFRQRVRAIIIDEAHSLYTVGLDLHGIRAFRKVYGRLHEIKALFGTYVPWLALTATAPRNMLKVIEKSILRANYTTIQLSVNRPNLMYACHQVVGSATCFDNFLCFLTRPFNLETQPRVLIAVEDSSQAVQLALFLRQHIPPAYRDKGVVRHQHSNMSPVYGSLAH
ncbi:P-loop containing nucleoside triphosphate hydrolase protein, partial [Schizophyllum commune]